MPKPRHTTKAPYFSIFTCLLFPMDTYILCYMHVFRLIAVLIQPYNPVACAMVY